MSYDAECGRSRVAQGGGLETSSSSRSFEIESWNYIQHRDYNLTLLQKKPPVSNRAKIPATKEQRLCFFRLSVTAPFKTHYLCIQYFGFNRFMWDYLFNFLFKSLPSYYVYMFLSAYVSDDHFYLSKMVPFAHGFDWGVIVSAVTECSAAVDILIRYLDYIVLGIYYKNPWNRCMSGNITFLGHHYQCLEKAEFKDELRKGNVTMSNDNTHFIGMNGEFQLAQIVFAQRAMLFDSNLFKLKLGYKPYMFAYCAVIWIVATLHYKHLFKRYIWKFLCVVHWLLNGLFIFTLLHLLWTYLETEVPKLIVASNRKLFAIALEHAQQADVNFIAESMTAPPLIHVLTGRCSKQVNINPGRDSTFLQISNGIFVMFRAIVTRNLKTYCEAHVGAEVGTSTYSAYPWFYLFPIYFSVFYLGDIFTLVFLILAFMNDLLPFIITYQCIIEVIVCEWPKCKRWLISIIIPIVGIGIFIIFGRRDRYLLFVIFKGILTLYELVLIVFLYPIGRLIDDITFHYGDCPSKFRIWSLRFVPFYYGYKLYSMLHGFLTLGILSRTSWYILLPIPFVPLFFGTILVIYSQLFRRRRNWRYLFRPIPKWGPREHLQRQLRKQYSSRAFVNSQSSRYLSRYIVSNGEAETYKLDICYEKAGRRSTVIHDAFRYDNEKKLV